MIISSGNRLNSIINDVLDFSKLKNSDLTLNLKSINLAVLVEIIIKMTRPLIKDKEVNFYSTIPKGLPFVHADEDRLQQILYNLISNAIKFTEKGHIAIDAKQVNQMIEISVSDSGIGIPQNKQEIIFNEFQQADGTISRQYAGFGSWAKY